MVRTRLFSMVLMIFSSVLVAQNTEAIQKLQEYVTKSNNLYLTKDTYRIAVNYTMFQGHDSQKKTESYDGYIVKDKGYSYTKIDQMEQVLLKEAYIKVSNEEKAILYADPVQAPKDQLASVDLAPLLENFEKVSFERSGKMTKFILTAAKISSSPFEKMEVTFGADYSITKQTFYFTNKMPFTQQNGTTVEEKPRLEISMSKPTPAKTTDLFSFSRYLVKTASGITASSNYKAYRVINAFTNKK